MFVLGSFFPALFVDRVGRRAPMIWGSLGLGICMMMVAVCLSFRGKEGEVPASKAAVAFFFLYMLIFGASVNCVPWCYVPEILPLHARAKGTAVGVSSNWIWVSRPVLALHPSLSLSPPALCLIPLPGRRDSYSPSPAGGKPDRTSSS